MREVGFGLIIGLVMALGAFAIAAWPVPGLPIAAFFPAGTSSSEMARAVSQAGGSILQLDTAAAVAISVGDGGDYAVSLSIGRGPGSWWMVPSPNLASVR